VFDREQNHLLKLLLGLFKTSDILPLDVGNFDVGFSERGRVDCTHGKLEVLLVDCHSLENLGVDLFCFNIDNVHLFTDALKGRLSAERSNVRTHKTMGIFYNCLKVDSFVKLHVFSVDSQDFKTTDLVRDTNIDLPIEATEPSEGGVKRVGPVGGSNNNDVSSSLEAVHEGEQLRDHSSLHLTVHLLSVRSNRIDLVDEDNSRTIFFSLLESLSKVALGLSGHLRHDFRTIDEEEECTSLIRHCTGDQSFSRTRRTI